MVSKGDAYWRVKLAYKPWTKRKKKKGGGAGALNQQENWGQKKGDERHHCIISSHSQHEQKFEEHTKIRRAAYYAYGKPKESSRFVYWISM